MGIGFLYNNTDYKYPNGKVFEDQDEYDAAKEAGWDTGPVDKANAKRAKAEEEAKAKAEAEAEVKEEVGAQWPSKEEIEAANALAPKDNPKKPVKRRRRKK